MSDTTFTSKVLDPQLFKILTSIEKFLEAKEIEASIEEYRMGETFLYFISNRKLGLTGWVGRSIESKSVVYVIRDEGRLNHCLQEGFSIEQAHDLEGIGIKVDGISSFICFMTGDKKYKVTGSYIKTASSA